ncbi:MAG: NADH-quinone oxidoreductase subunit L [Candidatus Verstraetearchaeota archaeon]|nr:NADH-quinone oxidoreductase subunit L [Candidatus Verstraetearchaeota archaeon]
MSFLLRKRAVYLATSASLASLLLITYNADALFGGRAVHAECFTWWPMPAYRLSFGIVVDPLSILMGAIVSFISTLVFIYSINYMAGKEGNERFWFFMSCFEASMLLLVFSDNLIMSLIGWEAVGLCSFFLIGHYYNDRRDKWLGGPEGEAPFAKPSFCGLKALITTGLADAFMLVGIMIIFSLYGTFSFLELQEAAASRAVNPTLLLLASILIIMGPLGKSAQFPFHEWLPEAMAGPTPVSALLHSATMVKAGVYLVARLMPFYCALAPAYPLASQAFFATATIFGLLTVIIGSIYGTLAIEAKKILAYSTVSQLGYMFVALGIAGISGNPLLGFAAALFHLFAHSLFKASLFLNAGIVTHETHTIYVTRMGGLRRVLPKTFLAMSLAAMSLAGLPPFIGFWSKDAILSSIYPVSVLVAVAAVSAAALTAFYSLRLVSLIFLGKPKSGAVKGHESIIMVGPAMLLASLTLIFGLAGPYIESLFHGVFHPTFEYATVYEGMVIPALASSALSLGLGMGAAYMLYFRRSAAFEGGARSLKPLRDFLWGRPVDKLYNLIVSGTFRVSGGFYSFEMALDRATVVFASDTLRLATIMRRIQSGDLNLYLGIAGLVLLLLLLALMAMGGRI